MQPRHVRGSLAPGQRIPGGERIGKGRAQSLEFDGLSPYAPGDDVRSIDWRATARTGRATVRRFAAQSHRGRLIVVDLVPEIFFGTGERLMAKTAALAAARLAWQSVLLQEPVDIAAPGMETRPPRRGRRHVLGLLEGLGAAYRAGGAHWDLGEALAGFAGRMARGDDIFVISEFADETIDGAASAVAGIRTLHALILDDPVTSRTLPSGTLPVRHPNGTRETLHLDGSEEALARVAERRAERRRRLQDLGFRVSAAHDVLPHRSGAQA